MQQYSRLHICIKVLSCVFPVLTPHVASRVGIEPLYPVKTVPVVQTDTNMCFYMTSRCYMTYTVLVCCL